MKVDLNIAAVNGDHVQSPQGFVTVTLSRRNVLSLLHKLDRDEEEGQKNTRTLMRSVKNGLWLTVVIEKDEDHYEDRTPGQMGIDIESKLAHEEQDRADLEALNRNGPEGN